MLLRVLEFAALLSYAVSSAAVGHQILLNLRGEKERSATTAGVSPVKYLLRGVANLMWLTYGWQLQEKDEVIVLGAMMMCALCSIILLQVLVYPPRRSATIWTAIVMFFAAEIGWVVIFMGAHYATPPSSLHLEFLPVISCLGLLVPGQAHQIHLNWKRKNTEGLSSFETIWGLCSFLIWCGYGLAKEAWPIWSSAILGGLPYAITIYQLWLYRHARQD